MKRLFPILAMMIGMAVSYAQPTYLSDFQYLTNSQSHGGGPFPVGSAFRYNTDGADTLLGVVHTNDDLSLSEFQQIDFYGPVSAVGNIITTGSNVFFHNTVEAYSDSFHFPTSQAIDLVKSVADFIFNADSMVTDLAKQIH